MESWPLHQVSLNGPENTMNILVPSSFPGCMLGPEAAGPFLLDPLAFRGSAEPGQKAPKGRERVGKANLEGKEVDIVILFREQAAHFPWKSTTNERTAPEIVIFSQVSPQQ